MNAFGGILFGDMLAGWAFAMLACQVEAHPLLIAAGSPASREVPGQSRHRGCEGIEPERAPT